MIIDIFSLAGEFAENKDVARDIRNEQLMPTLDKGQEVILDFTNVSLSTQSFIHALISNAMRSYGIDVLDKMLFKGCNERIQTLVNIVVDYMQEGLDPPEVINDENNDSSL